jgi:hypothetical protein
MEFNDDSQTKLLQMSELIESIFLHKLVASKKVLIQILLDVKRAIRKSWQHQMLSGCFDFNSILLLQ